MILQPRLYAGAFLFPCVAFCVTLYRAFILQGYTVPGNTNTAGNTAAPGGFPRWAATLLQYTQILILISRPGSFHRSRVCLCVGVGAFCDAVECTPGGGNTTAAEPGGSCVSSQKF